VLKLDSLGNFDFVSAINTITKTTESISLYPNPTNAIINIQALHPEEIKTISLFNINGSLINTYPYDSKSINLSEYANGNYYLKIQYQNSFETKKIIKL
jgi:Secretion system C-terminal sorting domain